MDRVFSVEDITEQFWYPEESSSSSVSAASKMMMMMNRSSSEWAFQRFLQEASALDSSSLSSVPPISTTTSTSAAAASSSILLSTNNNNTTSFAAGPPPNVAIDSEEYQAYLKSRLDLACAAVALTRTSSVKPQDSAAVHDNVSQASNTSQLGSQVSPRGSGEDLPKRDVKDAVASLGVPTLLSVQKKSAVQVKSTTSGSSRDLSDDDELEGDTETTQNMDPADAKRVRRMLSNRESARRSRRRKQAHLTELETQVSQLRVENSNLVKRLTGISQKYNEAAVDNRVLKADVETLRAKVKMAEETVKRVTGSNALFQAMSEISTMGMPSFDGSPSDTSTDGAVPVQDDQKHLVYQPASSNHKPAHDPRMQSSLLQISPVDNVQQNPVTPALDGNKMGRTPSMQRVASLEHLQKRIRGGVSSCSGTQCSGEQ